MRKMRRGVAWLFVLFFFSFILVRGAQSEEARFLKEGKKGHPKIEGALVDLQEKFLNQGKAISQEFAQRYDIRIEKDDRVFVFILPEERGGKRR